MTSHLARLGLGVLAALTLFLSAGGALGLWHTGAPAGPDVSTASAHSAAPASGDGSLRPAAARWSARDAEGANGDVTHDTPDAAPTAGPTPAPSAPQPSADPQSSPAPRSSAARSPESQQPSAAPKPATPADVALPPGSGTGRRVVFDISAQRVWIVGSAGKVQRTYPVSGSRGDNLDPGHYEVYSRSRHAVSYTYEETMQYMVRFATGDNAAIGFHDIPVDEQGDPVQTRAQLGQQLSSGCVRQARPDAIAMWRFADIGTPVVVTP
jgi:lipoprotein-anchoring transpeptidase ErfK/SrfK